MSFFMSIWSEYFDDQNFSVACHCFWAWGCTMTKGHCFALVDSTPVSTHYHLCVCAVPGFRPFMSLYPLKDRPHPKNPFLSLTELRGVPLPWILKKFGGLKAQKPCQTTFRIDNFLWLINTLSCVMEFLSLRIIWQSLLHKIERKLLTFPKWVMLRQHLGGYVSSRHIVCVQFLCPFFCQFCAKMSLIWTILDSLWRDNVGSRDCMCICVCETGSVVLCVANLFGKRFFQKFLTI